MFELMCINDLEGVVAKRLADPYDSRIRWLKIKNPDYSQKDGRGDLLNRPRRPAHWQGGDEILHRPANVAGARVGQAAQMLAMRQPARRFCTDRRPAINRSGVGPVGSKVQLNFCTFRIG